MESRLGFALNLRVLRVFLALSFACLVGATALFGGTSSSTDGSTPAGLSPGAPMGAYSLSDFENVNLYNGGLNFSLALLQVGGRGEPRAPIVLPIEMKWRVSHVTIPKQTGSPDHFYYPTYDWWTIRRSYSPGLMTGRYSGEGIGCGIYTTASTRTLARITFSDVNGTEYDFRDQLTNGEPTPYCTYVTQGRNRGKIFVTADGSAATFTSDTDILDSVNPDYTTFYPSGVLAMRDGTRYRIDQGTVTWMRDSNGNKMTFTYDGFKRVTGITDSINRQYSIVYGTNQDTITYKSWGGQQQTIQVYYQPLAEILRTGFTLQTFAQLFPTLNGPTQSSNPLLVSRVTLPNGQEYRMRYNSYGELARLELPTGGAVEYDYDGGVAAGSGVITQGSTPDEKAVYRRLVERREYPDGVNRALRTAYLRPADASPTVVTVDHYDASNTRIARERHTFSGRPKPTFFKTANSYSAWQEGMETITEKLAADGLTLLRTSVNTWAQGGTVAWWTGTLAAMPAANPRIVQRQNWLLDNGSNLVSKTTYAYDQYNNVSDVYEYDSGVGAEPAYASRRTRTTYVTNYLVGTTTYAYDTNFSIHIRDLPQERWLYNVNPATGAETEVSRSRFNYDRYDATANHAPLVNRTSLAGFDSTFTTSYKTRGNATSIDRWLNTQSIWVSTYSQYDIAGNVVKTVDPRGYATSYDFTDVFGTPDGQARTNTSPPELGASKAFAFVSRTTNPLNHVGYAQYDYWTGLPVDAEDINGNLRSFTHDKLGRPIRISNADGGWVEIYYSDTDLNVVRQGSFVFLNRTSSNPVRRKVYSSVDTGLERIELTVYDGFGRVSMAGASNRTKLDWTRREYDAFFGIFRVSNPVSLANTVEIPTAGNFTRWTTNTYDPLGRVVTVTTQDGQTATTAYVGNRTTVTDQLGNPLRYFHDGLGRMTSAVEPNPANAQFDGSSLTTTYQYDAGDRLTQVTQGSQQRTYSYDSLGRLTQEIIPEWGPPTAATGSASYTYDASSNLATKTDARSVTTSWNSYDGLNRPASRTYSDPATPRVDYTYDSISTPNGKGRLTSMTDGAGGESYEYDSMGRVSKLTRSNTGGPTLTGNYTYNRLGGVKSAAFPGILDGATALTILWQYDNAGRQTSALWDNGSTAFQRMVNDYTFDRSSTGGTEQTVFANNTTETILYNDRLQPTSRSIPGILNLTYGFGRSSDGKNNGNIHQILDGMVTGWNFTYTYDALNRILTSTGPGSTLINFSFDRWGNKSQTSTTGPNKPLSFTANGFFKNRISTSGYSYDNAGNLLAEPLDTWTGRGAVNYAYDAESRVKTASGAASASYAYDGNGRRVKKVAGGQTRYYYYDPLGNPIWEYTTLWETFNLYFNGRLVFINTAAMSPFKIWLGLDHLGTPRIKANEQGQPISGTRLYYHPFGERANPKSDPVKYEFTGKERDPDTGLDYFGARYYANTVGRFVSTDPLRSSAEIGNPQSWNRFAYTLNNPLRFTDPTGMYICSGTAAQCKAFEEALAKVKKARDAFSKKSDEYKRLAAVLDAYGPRGVANGVTVRFGPTGTGHPAATQPGLAVQQGTAKREVTATNPSGQNTDVIVDLSRHLKGKRTDTDNLAVSAGHEGAHVANTAALVAALPIDLEDGSAATVLAGPLNLTTYALEFQAYTISSLVAEGLGFGKLEVGSFEIWNSGWTAHDAATLRDKGIKGVLADPNGTYKVTEQNQGKKFFVP